MQLRGLLNDVMPPVAVTITKRPSSPWFVAECRASWRNTRVCEQRYRRAGSHSDLISLRAALEDKKVVDCKLIN